MNPAHLLIASLVLLAVFWLGVWTESEGCHTFCPGFPAFLLNLACVAGIVTSLCWMVGHFLTVAQP